MRVLPAVIVGAALAAASPAIACGGKEGLVSGAARGNGSHIDSIDITHLADRKARVTVMNSPRLPAPTRR